MHDLLERVLAAAHRANIGVLCMFAVRAALSQPDKLVQTVRELIDRPMRVDDLALSVNPAGVELTVPLRQSGALPFATAGDRMRRPNIGEEPC